MSRTLIALSVTIAFFTALLPAEAEAKPRPIIKVVTVPPAAAAPGAVWIPQQRVWNPQLQRYVVVAGHWKTRPRATAVWVPGHWEMRGRNRVWIAGHWRG